MWTTNFYQNFAKYILLSISSWLSKIRSVHRYVMLCPGRFILVEFVKSKFLSISDLEYPSKDFTLIICNVLTFASNFRGCN